MEFVGALPSLLLKVGLGVGAGVILLYILKLRRRPIAVPFADVAVTVVRSRA